MFVKHYLKTWPIYFEPVNQRLKNFDIRKEDDRHFDICDNLIFEEWDPETGKYTGRETARSVTYLLRDQPFVPEGYVVMSW